MRCQVAPNSPWFQVIWVGFRATVRVQEAIVIIVVIRVFPSAVSVRLDGLDPV